MRETLEPALLPAVREGRFQWCETDRVAYLAPAATAHVHVSVQCVFTSRLAGRSGRTFNLSFDRGEREAVLANRSDILAAMGLASTTLHTVRQVHGNAVCIIDADTTVHDLAGIRADALVTDQPSTPLGVLAADCLPVILYSRQPRALAVVHAGRMGTFHRVVPGVLEVMRTRFKAGPEHIHAILGPGIGACCYRLDTRAVAPFQDCFTDWADYFIPQEPGYWTMSLTQANQAQLQAAGVPKTQVQTADMCTVCHLNYLFSHRVEGENAGRGMAIAALLPAP